MKGEHSKTESDLESIIGASLRYGVIISSSLIVLGLLLSPFRIGSYSGFPSTLEAITKEGYGKPTFSFGGLATGLTQLNPLSIIELGVLLLMAIPFFRVAVGGLMFAAERNWKYIIISAVVLGILLFGTFVVGPFEASK